MFRHSSQTKMSHPDNNESFTYYYSTSVLMSALPSKQHHLPNPFPLKMWSDFQMLQSSISRGPTKQASKLFLKWKKKSVKCLFNYININFHCFSLLLCQIKTIMHCPGLYNQIQVKECCIYKHVPTFSSSRFSNQQVVHAHGNYDNKPQQQ